MSFCRCSFAALVIWLVIESCSCTSKEIRVLGKPKIRPLYLNVSEWKGDNVVTMHGRFQCPPDTTAEFSGKTISFDNVSDSMDGSSNFKMVLFDDRWGWLPRLTLSSKSASEEMHIYLSDVVDDNVQTSFLGTNCLVGINRSSEKQSTTYTSVIQSCNNAPIIEKFNIGLNKSGEIIRLDSDVYCYGSNDEYGKYFKSRCSMYISNDPLYVTFYEENMAADNIELYYLTYQFDPVGPCSHNCISDIKRWFFSVV
ncbi:uncharacterized protein LOC133197934 [Saccostrea echinata]|uniref:uncharacterized protein LOC133197934 n=1 Tax=Saccostrea echinata TaxID=191078 RepID=UPI002A826300|nr:uncharacterized protein LOC133197934 [Saccostrea echinata]